MPTSTYVALATQTLGTTATSVTFSSIPSTYRDLVLVVRGSTTVDASAGIYLNGDSGANYYATRGYGTGSGTGSQSFSGQNYVDLDTGTTNSDCMWIVHFLDYSATDKHKTMLTKANQSNVTMWSQKWASTSAITSIEVSSVTSTWAAGTTFNLWGIAS